MASLTRRVHVVRISMPLPEGQVAGPDNPQPFVDVQILDAVSLQTDGGEELLYDTGSANPHIVDNTGDGSAKGSALSCSRSSHMVRMTGKADSSQFFDAEILDAFALKGPNGSEFLLEMTGETAFVTDHTGSGLGVGYETGATTRAAHIVKVKPPPPTDGSTPDPAQFVLVQRTDKIAFRGPNGEEYLIDVSGADDVGGATTNDTTHYSVDPVTGDPVPPDNADPNKYIVFPLGSSGPFLGADQAVNQGLLWWIVKVGNPTSPHKGGKAGYTLTVTVTCGAPPVGTDTGPIDNIFEIILAAYGEGQVAGVDTPDIFSSSGQFQSHSEEITLGGGGTSNVAYMPPQSFTLSITVPPSPLFQAPVLVVYNGGVEFPDGSAWNASLTATDRNGHATTVGSTTINPPFPHGVGGNPPGTGSVGFQIAGISLSFVPPPASSIGQLPIMGDTGSGSVSGFP